MARHGSFQNQQYSKMNSLKPEVGMGATEICWSDRHAYTIIEVINDTKIVVQQDKATRTDANGMSDAQSYAFSPDLSGSKRTLSLRKNGRWVPVGLGMNDGNFVIGMRQEYYDYSF